MQKVLLEYRILEADEKISLHVRSRDVKWSCSGAFFRRLTRNSSGLHEEWQMSESTDGWSEPFSAL